MPPTKCNICKAEVGHDPLCPAVYDVVWRVTAKGDGTIICELSDALDIEHIIMSMRIVAKGLEQGTHTFTINNLN